MYDLCTMFKTKVPQPTRKVLWHHIVIPALIELSNCNVDIVDIIDIVDIVDIVVGYGDRDLVPGHT